jgi:hypothetical protein
MEDLHCASNGQSRQIRKVLMIIEWHKIEGDIYNY